jgi:pimeloyl-ACP methyl ester carboxylesterase
MIPFYFGSSKEPLLGAYHTPLTQGARDSAVLLCQPLFQEYMRAHWSFRRLADLLSKAGFHVLRFDYFGTGDSAGQSSDGTVERWQDDIRSAANELLELSGKRFLSVVGLRAGAALAATTEGLDTKDLVLWDPIISGHSYIKELRRIHHSKLEEYNRIRHQPILKNNYELLGFPFPPTMQDSIEQIDLLSGFDNNAKNIFIFSSETIEELPQLQKVFQVRGATFALEIIDEVGDWDKPSRLYDAFLPNAILSAIVNALVRK